MSLGGRSGSPCPPIYPTNSLVLFIIQSSGTKYWQCRAPAYSRGAVCGVNGREGFASHAGRPGCTCADVGVALVRGDAQIQAQHIRGEVSPYQLTPTAAALQFASSQLWVVHLKSMEVLLSQVLIFCKAVTDFDCEYGT